MCEDNILCDDKHNLIESGKYELTSNSWSDGDPRLFLHGTLSYKGSNHNISEHSSKCNILCDDNILSDDKHNLIGSGKWELTSHSWSDGPPDPHAYLPGTLSYK